MKLRNKLIPLFSVAATAVTVAPLATSCGNIILEEVEYTDVLHGYVPDIERAVVEGTISSKQAKDLYIDHIKKNPQIFAEDLYWWEGLAAKYRIWKAAVGGTSSLLKTAQTNKLDPKYNNTSFLSDLIKYYGLYPTTQNPEDSFDIIPSVAKFSVSDISFKDVELVNDHTQEKEIINTISLKFNYDYKFEINADVANNLARYSAQRFIDVSLTSEYKDIPFTVLWDTQYACWRIMPIGWYQVFGNDKTDTTWIAKKLHDWSFNFDYKSTTTDVIKSYEGGVDTYTYDGSKGGLIDSYAKLKNWLPSEIIDDENDYDVLEEAVRGIVFNFGSYHMYDVVGPQWSFGNLGYLNNNVITKGTSDVYNITMPQALTRSWTYNEYWQNTRPTSDFSWTLTSVTQPGVEKKQTFDLVDVQQNNKVVGLVKFDTKVNVSPGTIGSLQTYFNIDLSVNVTITDDYTKTKINDNPDLLKDNKSYTFTVPNQTTFEMKVCVGKDSKGVAIYQTETFQIDADIKCFWRSTGSMEQ